MVTDNINTDLLKALFDYLIINLPEFAISDPNCIANLVEILKTLHEQFDGDREKWIWLMKLVKQLSSILKGHY